MGMFSSQAVVGGITGLFEVFGRLIGAIKAWIRNLQRLLQEAMKRKGKSCFGK